MLDLDDGAVEELLFGWFEGQNREGEQKHISVVFIPSFSLFGITTNCLLSRDIINPII
jgi:hypothetical protein